MAPWVGRLAPESFCLVGGEPTINPKLAEMVYLAARFWPRSQLRLITNGFFLHKHPRLPEVLAATRAGRKRCQEGSVENSQTERVSEADFSLEIKGGAFRECAPMEDVFDRAFLTPFPLYNYVTDEEFVMSTSLPSDLPIQTAGITCHPAAIPHEDFAMRGERG